jgi:hypothetical protein
MHRPQREEVNQPPLCIPTISQPIHAKAEHPSFNATSKIRVNCRVRAKEIIGWRNTALRSDADP